MASRVRIQSSRGGKTARLKRKVVKKLNPLNVGVVVFSLFVGYLIVSIFYALQDGGTKQGTVVELTRPANRIADAFELYNRKRFVNDGLPR